MDVLAAVLACSLYPRDEPLVRALATSNSDANPYFVYDPTVDSSQSEAPPEPRSTTQALARAQEVLSKRATPLLGLLDVPPGWLSAFGRTLEDGFDPCVNVAVGTAYLSAFDDECARTCHVRSPAHNPARRDCVLRRYAEAIQMPDLEAIVSLELRFQKALLRSVYESPIFPPGPPHSWGADRIFAPLSSPLPSPLAKRMP